jgi:hypothetical protein
MSAKYLEEKENCIYPTVYKVIQPTVIPKKA